MYSYVVKCKSSVLLEQCPLHDGYSLVHILWLMVALSYSSRPVSFFKPLTFSTFYLNHILLYPNYPYSNVKTLCIRYTYSYWYEHMCTCKKEAKTPAHIMISISLSIMKYPITNIFVQTEMTFYLNTTSEALSIAVPI